MRSCGPARPLLGALLGVLLVTGADRAVFGQRYELSDEDTWERTDTIDPASPQGALAAARTALAEGRYKQARKLATGFIDTHDGHALLPHAYLVRGDALMAQKKYYDALFDYEFVAVGFTASEAFVTALEREMEIARLYATGTKRKLFGMRIIDAGDEAEELLIRIQERMPGSRLAEDAAMELGDFYFRRRRMELAAEMYSIFLENYPNSQRRSDARKRLIYAYLATFKGPQFDAAGLGEARAHLHQLMNAEPAVAQKIGAEALLTRIDESEARKLLLTARWYVRVGDPIGAEFVLRQLLRRFPRTVAATEALRLAASLQSRLPAGVLSEAPDYRALRQAILGGSAGAASAPDDEAPRDTSDHGQGGAP